MNLLIGFLYFLLVVDCLMLCLLVLIQSGSGGGLASAFGGAGGEDTLLGSRGNQTLNKLTSWFAAGFMVLCCILAFISGRHQGSVTEGVPSAPTVEGTSSTEADDKEWDNTDSDVEPPVAPDSEKIKESETGATPEKPDEAEKGETKISEEADRDAGHVEHVHDVKDKADSKKSAEIDTESNDSDAPTEKDAGPPESEDAGDETKPAAGTEKPSETKE